MDQNMVAILLFLIGTLVGHSDGRANFPVHRTEVKYPRRVGRWVDATKQKTTGTASWTGIVMSVEVALGSQNLTAKYQLDTGSPDFVVLTGDCDGCNTPTKPAYSPDKSTTSKKPLSCVDPDCKFTVSYGDGTTLSGRYVLDTMQLTTDITHPIIQFGSRLGAVTKASGGHGNFGMNGILGLSYTLFPTAFSGLFPPYEDIFALATGTGQGFGKGIFTVGGYDPTYITPIVSAAAQKKGVLGIAEAKKDPNIFWLNLLPQFTAGKSYIFYWVNVDSVHLYANSAAEEEGETVLIHDLKAQEGAESAPNSIIDSGTTDLMVQGDTFNKIVKGVQGHVIKKKGLSTCISWTVCGESGSIGNFWTGYRTEIKDDMMQVLPHVLLRVSGHGSPPNRNPTPPNPKNGKVFPTTNGIDVLLAPSDWFRPATFPGLGVNRIAPMGPPGSEMPSIILGDTFMSPFYVIFNRENSQVGIANAAYQKVAPAQAPEPAAPFSPDPAASPLIAPVPVPPIDFTSTTPKTTGLPSPPSGDGDGIAVLIILLIALGLSFICSAFIGVGIWYFYFRKDNAVVVVPGGGMPAGANESVRIPLNSDTPSYSG